MLFVIVGVLIIAMNLAGIGWFATWNWDFTGDLWKFCGTTALSWRAICVSCAIMSASTPRTGGGPRKKTDR